jgi:peptidylprolyl isomerase
MSTPKTQEKTTDSGKKTNPTNDDTKKCSLDQKYILIAIAAIALVAVAAFAVLVLLPQEEVTRGDNVSVYYTMMFENGTVIETNLNGTPQPLTVGSPDLIEGFSEALVGMRLNQKKTMTVPSDKAYGPYRNELVRTVNRTGPLASRNFTVGQYYTVFRKTDNAMSSVRIVNVTDSTVTWDENSLLAGQNLTFSVQVVNITKKSGEAMTLNLSSSMVPTKTVP